MPREAKWIGGKPCRAALLILFLWLLQGGNGQAVVFLDGHSQNFRPEAPGIPGAPSYRQESELAQSFPPHTPDEEIPNPSLIVTQSESKGPGEGRGDGTEDPAGAGGESGGTLVKPVAEPEGSPGAPKQEPAAGSSENPGAPGEESNAPADAPDEDAKDEEFDEEFEKEFGKSIESKIYDPFSGYNRAMTVFNDKVYFWFLEPVSRGYRAVVWEGGRRGIANFTHNLLFPLRFTNNLLQLKIKNSGIELLRFCINTTIGLLGFFDPAKHWFGLEAKEEDFGQTLGYWGVGAGPHIVLPFLGPSNLRDMFSLVPDYYLDPVRFVEPDRDEYGVRIYNEVNDTSLHPGEYENLKKDAVDLYPFLRDVYEQNRQKKILE